MLRKEFAYGEQDDYLELENLIGWVRRGNEQHPGRLAVLISNGDMGTLKMFVGEDQAGKFYIDYLGNNEEVIEIDSDGYGEFCVSPGSISAWVEQKSV